MSAQIYIHKGIYIRYPLIEKERWDVRMSSTYICIYMCILINICTYMFVYTYMCTYMY